MAIEHARMCGSCDRECPSWADRCPACGNTSMFRRIVMIPTAPSFQRAEPVTLITAKIAARKRIKTLKTPADGASEVSVR
jgi:predicted ATP-dependent serine protease